MQENITSSTTKNSPRVGEVTRKTRETEVAIRLSLDGTGKSVVSTGLGFFDHMLELFVAHAGFDLELSARGDLHTGGHHTVEDVGITMGLALQEALGSKVGIERYGWSLVPMDEALAMCAVDLSGRPYFSYDGPGLETRIGEFETVLVFEFYRALVNNARMTLHLRLLAGTDPHHMVEALFKVFARALGQAVRRREDLESVPSTKGVL